MYNEIMWPKDADRMTNSVDPDQIVQEPGLQCLPGPVCLSTLNRIITLFGILVQGFVVSNRSSLNQTLSHP